MFEEYASLTIHFRRTADRKNPWLWVVAAATRHRPRAVTGYIIPTVKTAYGRANFILLSCLFDEKKYQELNEYLISQIKNSNFNSLEYWELLRIYAFSIRVGLLELAYIFRKKAMDQALEYTSNLNYGKTWKIKAKLSALKTFNKGI